MEEEIMDPEVIHNSLVNGQRQQAYEQMEEMGFEDFFNEYPVYLHMMYSDEGERYEYFKDAVKCFTARYQF